MSTTQNNWTTGFYWIGMASAVGCLAFTLAANTELLWRFEHTGFPFSWALAGAAVLAFVAFEFCDSEVSSPSEAEDQSPELSPEWEAVEP
jgi:hypothetical protein